MLKHSPFSHNYFQVPADSYWHTPSKKSDRTIDTSITTTRIDKHKPIGKWARQLFWQKNLYRRYYYPSVKLLHLPGMRTLWMVAYGIYAFTKMALPVRAKFGISLHRQLTDLFRLGFTQGIDGVSYYLLELYRDPTHSRAAASLTRFETKNGLFLAMRANLRGSTKKLYPTNKLLLSQYLKKANLPTPAMLLSLKGSRIIFHEFDERQFHCDLFVKLQHGKGARNVETIHFISPDCYRLSKGPDLTFADVLSYLSTKSSKEEYIVVPRLRNAAAIRGLSQESLTPIRVVTCLDEKNEPIVALSYLRVLCKLEKWNNSAELAAPLDLNTGKLGKMVGDKINWRPLERFSTHPFTGQRLEDVRVPFCRDINSIAVQAHRLFPQYAVIGWDIAITDKGPVILEANTAPDVAFLQRTFNQPIGWMTLGELLAPHLKRISLSQKRWLT